MILLAVPVLNRPHRAERLAESAREGTAVPHRLLFLCSPGDEAEIVSCERTGASVRVVDWPAGRGDYARKVNLAVNEADEEWVLMAADDVCFCPGWAENALAKAEETGAMVVGTQDWGNPRVLRGEHSTHPLVNRLYVQECGTIDEPGLMLHEGYRHNFCDDELVSTAKHRDVWAFCAESEIPHHHPDWGRAATDATYLIGKNSFEADRSLYRQRCKLWT